MLKFTLLSYKPLRVSSGKLNTNMIPYRAFSYALFQRGRQCYCDTGDSYDRHGTSWECDFRCPSDTDTKCGGDEEKSVYVGEKIHSYKILIFHQSNNSGL